MIINELNKLENCIRRGEWQPEKGIRLWGGADVIVKFKRTDELNAWESDNNLSVDADGLKQSSKILIISKHARHISALFYAMKEIFNDYLDFANKYTFYGRLGKRAKAYIDKKDDQGVLLEIIAEAKLIANEFEGKLYFAYGSNMDESQMAHRCPTAKLVGQACLNGYRFIINDRGVASIIRNDDSFVDGILWSVFPVDEEALDHYEGISSNFYFKTEITAENIQTGEQCSAMVYIASDDSLGQPYPGYLERIIKAADKFRFDSNYRMELIGWLE
ncbi:MAG: gamma-glutamylcyclotransferase [Desulfitobacteriaceae bacterium]|nr:gamma-glutamylcyclotransferase [Desulfitobacteriaceae bacterium]